jgi:hypothetical protein
VNEFTHNLNFSVSENVSFLVLAVGLSDLKDRINGSENACIMEHIFHSYGNMP